MKPRWTCPLFVILATATAGAPSPALARQSTRETSAQLPATAAVHAGPVERTDRAKDTSKSGATCADYLFPVTIEPGASEVYKVFGRLCSHGPMVGRTVQVLLHGGSYDHNYWDWPYQPETYSYVKRATEAGFVTLDIDRLGYGLSDHPNPSVGVTFASNGWVAHQIVEHLRNGALGDRFHRVMLVGHSMGGLTTRIAAGYGNVDGVVISGFTHLFNYPGAFGVIASFYPADLDPKFSGQLPIGSLYTTTRPGTRCYNGFYLSGAYDPAICAIDERLKATVTAGEWRTVGIDGADPNHARKITAHVLVTLGSNDVAMCITTCFDDPTVRYEDTMYPNAASYERYVQPASGHDQNLHRTAPQVFDKLIAWSLDKVGVNG